MPVGCGLRGVSNKGARLLRFHLKRMHRPHNIPEQSPRCELKEIESELATLEIKLLELL